MRNRYWYGLAGVLIGGVFVASLYFFGWLSCREVANLEREVANLESRAEALQAAVVEKSRTIIAYQRALIGEERDLLSLYDSVETAKQIEVVVYADTESGLPVKFRLACEEERK